MKGNVFLLFLFFTNYFIYGQVTLEDTRIWLGSAPLKKVLQVPERMWTPFDLPLPEVTITKGDFWLAGRLKYDREQYAATPYLNLGRWSVPFEFYIDGILVLRNGDFDTGLPFSMGTFDIVTLPPPDSGTYDFLFRVKASEGEQVEQSWSFLGKEGYFQARLLDFWNVGIYSILALLVAFIGIFFLMQFMFDPGTAKNLFFGLANLSFSLYFLLAMNPPELLPGVRFFALGKAFLFPSLSFLLLFFLHFFRIGQNTLVYTLISAVTGFLFFSNVFLPETFVQVNTVFSLSLIGGQFLLLIMIILTIVAWIQGNRDAPIILAGAFFGVALGLFDVWHMIFGLRPLVWLQGIGIFLFNFSMFVSLALKNHKDSRKIEASHHIIQEKKKELEAANESLKALDQIKDQFLANTSHELRTPLNGMMGLLEQVLDPRAETLTAEQRRLLELVRTSAGRLEKLIRDILDFSLLKNRKMMLRPSSTDLNQLLSRVIDLLKPTIGEKPVEVRLKADKLPLLVIDGSRLEQVMVNLVGNALKFTREGWVEVRAVKLSTSIRIEVEDTGIGISPENQSRVFDSFQQGNRGIVREFGGTGLGLTISKDILGLMDSHLALDSVQGKGTVFRFDLPLSPFPEENVQALTPGGDPKEPQPALKILAVDDEPINLEVIKGQLRHTAFQVKTAGSGMEALALLESENFDLLVLDIMMPIVSGFETVQLIRKEGRDLPVLLLTARNTPQDLLQGIRHGANGLLEKPSKGKELIQFITALHTLEPEVRSQSWLTRPGTWISWRYPEEKGLMGTSGSERPVLREGLPLIHSVVQSQEGEVLWLDRTGVFIWIPGDWSEVWTHFSRLITQKGEILHTHQLTLVLQERTTPCSLEQALEVHQILGFKTLEMGPGIYLGSMKSGEPGPQGNNFSMDGQRWHISVLTSADER